MKILAIDPGYERLGIAILEKDSSFKENLIFSECFKTSKDLPHDERLGLIGEEIRKVINEYKPDTLSIESLFFNTNQKTVMKVSEARGAIISECRMNDLSVFEYTPLQIKVAVTGYGRSDKNSVIKMIPHLIEIKKDIKYDDEYDAIAVGLTHFASYRG